MRTEKFDEGLTQVAPKGNFKAIGCGLLVAKTKDGEIKCGEKMLGKRRYCAYCQNLIKNSRKDENLYKRT